MENSQNKPSTVGEKTDKYLPFKDGDKRLYSELTIEEKSLRHLQSIDRNIRFFAWIILIPAIIFAAFGLYLIATRNS
jgi:hypothetical protein